MRSNRSGFRRDVWSCVSESGRAIPVKGFPMYMRFTTVSSRNCTRSKVVKGACPIGATAGVGSPHDHLRPEGILYWVIVGSAKRTGIFSSCSSLTHAICLARVDASHDRSETWVAAVPDPCAPTRSVDRVGGSVARARANTLTMYRPTVRHRRPKTRVVSVASRDGCPRSPWGFRGSNGKMPFLLQVMKAAPG